MDWLSPFGINLVRGDIQSYPALRVNTRGVDSVQKPPLKRLVSRMPNECKGEEGAPSRRRSNCSFFASSSSRANQADPVQQDTIPASLSDTVSNFLRHTFSRFP